MPEHAWNRLTATEPRDLAERDAVVRCPSVSSGVAEHHLAFRLG